MQHTNPFTDALEFLLKHVVRHGDGVAAPAAQKHLEAIAAIDVADVLEPALEPQVSESGLVIDALKARQAQDPAALAGVVDAVVSVLQAGGPAAASSQSAPQAIAPDQAPAK